MDQEENDAGAPHLIRQESIQDLNEMSTDLLKPAGKLNGSVA